MRIQDPQGISLNNPLLLSESTIMISHGLPDKIVGKNEIAHDE